MKSILLTASAIALLSGAASAQDSNLRFGLGVSTMGATLEGAYRFNQNWAVRGIVAGGLNANQTQTVDGVSYKTSGQLGGFALLADYYTGNSGFRISGGAFVSNTKFKGSTTASLANPITVGNVTANNGETASATIEFKRKISPMLTAGYDWNIAGNFTLSGEIGAIAMGGLDVSLSAPAIAAAEVAREEKNIKDELSAFGVYPYVAITGTFRF